MKKKTNHHLHHRNNRSRSSNSSNTNNNNSVLGILQSVIFCRRRRFRGQLLPFISAVGGCILFFFAIVSFLSPPINHHHVHHFRYNHSSITDAVVAAYILNSTLVVPKLDNKSYWKDQSNFSDIFDVDWFISYLSKDVKIVKEVPMIEGRSIHPYQMRIPRKCDPECYHSRALPLLEKKKVVMLTKFDYRLSNRLDPDLQKLRCRANYHALRYTEPICEMDLNRTCSRSPGATLEKRDPDKERRLGRCPLTPEEVGLMLRALGYGEDVHIYVASGEVYGGENTLSPLKQLFPNFHSKDTIATKEELAPFAPYSSRMAALDFIVCNASDVFVTNNNGNMAKMLAGRRRYFGYKPTIRPNAKKLYRLFLDRGNMTWEEFASRVRTHQIGFMGRPNEAMPGKGEFHEYPIVCICEDLNTQIQNRSQGLSQNQSEPNNHDVQANKRDRNESESVVKEQQRGNEEHNNSYTQQIENGNGTRVKELLRRNKNDSDCGLEEGHQTNT
ncbi:GDP-fucose protein O-fucosyltransferase [Cynara cardunculus var. scolymus]|uniref:O-fucosyltransferase family protein n=1 Tax=Cynara cardunculus var. scolymus TaxID=59895 RepID=A0A103XTF3_CYNCS|nr:GDP-fucose protein O-fucosyltransferase [Cynara cardunculus var. scolymus]